MTGSLVNQELDTVERTFSNVLATWYAVYKTFILLGAQMEVLFIVY